MNDDNYGSMDHSFTVWCGRCGEWDQFSTRLKRRAAMEFKRSGWTFTRALGWRCPQCSKEKQP